MCGAHAIYVWCFSCITHVIHAPVIYMLNTCNTHVHTCNTCVYPTHVYMCRTCVLHRVSTTHVIHLYFYTCNIPKTTHMYYKCSTTGHVRNIKYEKVYKYITCVYDYHIGKMTLRYFRRIECLGLVFIMY